MRLRRLALLLPLALLACLQTAPILEHTTQRLALEVLDKVAVVPFYPMPALARTQLPPGVDAAQAADLVARFVTETLEESGIPVVAPSDLVIAFEGEGQVLPRQDPAAAAAVAARDFGATAVLTGKLMRYREREGGELGARVPASVWFEVELHSAPAGERLFRGRFDQTQPTVSGNPLLARQYPRSGTRWLSAAELTRFGAGHIAGALKAAPKR